MEPHGVPEWSKVDRHDLHDTSYSCDVRPVAKAHISHGRVVRLITVRKSGWIVEVSTTLFLPGQAYAEKSVFIIDGTVLSLCLQQSGAEEGEMQ